MLYEFEWDPVKSSANKAKHGIDFVEAQELWLDPAASPLGPLGTGAATPLHRQNR